MAPITIVVALVGVLAAGAVQGSDGPDLRALTVPPDRLPSSCSLRPPPEPTRGRGVVVVAVSDRLSLENPWISRERKDVAEARRVVDGYPRLPDWPRVSRRDGGDYVLRLADHVVEAYRAWYVSSYTGHEFEVVAVRFDDPARANAPLPVGTLDSGLNFDHRIVIGSVVVAAPRPSSDTCARAVRQHIESLR